MIFILVTVAAACLFLNEIAGLTFGWSVPNSFRWYRKWRGGRWAKLRMGWMQVPPGYGKLADDERWEEWSSKSKGEPQ